MLSHKPLYLDSPSPLVYTCYFGSPLPLPFKHSCLLLRLKFRSARGASCHPAFIDNGQTISHTSHSPTSGWRKQSVFKVNSIHCLGSVQEFGILKTENRDKKRVALLQRSEMPVGWYFISLILGLSSCQTAADVTSPWPNGQRIRFQP